MRTAGLPGRFVRLFPVPLGKRLDQSEVRIQPVTERRGDADRFGGRSAAGSGRWERVYPFWILPNKPSGFSKQTTDFSWTVPIAPVRGTQADSSRSPRFHSAPGGSWFRSVIFHNRPFRPCSRGRPVDGGCRGDLAEAGRTLPARGDLGSSAEAGWKAYGSFRIDAASSFYEFQKKFLNRGCPSKTLQDPDAEGQKILLARGCIGSSRNFHYSWEWVVVVSRRRRDRAYWAQGGSGSGLGCFARARSRGGKSVFGGVYLSSMEWRLILGIDGLVERGWNGREDGSSVWQKPMGSKSSVGISQ